MRDDNRKVGELGLDSGPISLEFSIFDVCGKVSKLQAEFGLVDISLMFRSIVERFLWSFFLSLEFVVYESVEEVEQVRG